MKHFKKIISLFLVIIMILLFSCCSKNIAKKSELSVSNEIKNNGTSVSEKLDYDNKTPINKDEVKSISVTFMGYKTDIEVNDKNIEALSQIDELSEEVDIKLSNEIGNIVIEYVDGTEMILGTLFVGEDNAYYLQSSKNKGTNKCYKVTDNLFDTQ